MGKKVYCEDCKHFGQAATLDIWNRVTSCTNSIFYEWMNTPPKRVQVIENYGILNKKNDCKGFVPKKKSFLGIESHPVIDIIRKDFLERDK